LEAAGRALRILTEPARDQKAELGLERIEVLLPAWLSHEHF